MRQTLSSATPETGSPPAPPPRAPYTERIAGWSARHRKTAVLGWLALTAAAFIGGQQLGTRDLPSYDAGQSGQAERTLDRLGVTQPATERVLIAERPGQPGTYRTDPALRRATAEVTTALAALPHAAAHISGPGRAGGAGLVSADGRSALVTFTVPGNQSNVDQAVVPAMRAVERVQAAHPGLRIAEAGDATEDRAANKLISQDFRKAEVTSVPITLVLLLGVFGALIAAGIPLLLAATAVMTAISLLAIPSHWLPVGGSTSEVVLIIGMAVGIDYSLFYLRREREERARGASTAEALRIAARTSGRAIVVSGLTVMTALAGLFLSGYDVFSGIAVGTIVVVGVAVLGSLTALPALLSWLGPWADRARIPWLGKRRTAAKPSRLWAALVRRVVRRPAVWAAVAGDRPARAGRARARHAHRQPAQQRFPQQPAGGRHREPDRRGVPRPSRARAGRGHRAGPGTARGGPGGRRAAREGDRYRAAAPAGHRVRGSGRPRAGDRRSAGGQRG